MNSGVLAREDSDSMSAAPRGIVAFLIGYDDRLLSLKADFHGNEVTRHM